MLFWPAAIALAATKDQESALSSAKGNYDAITAQMTSKGCTIPAGSAQVVTTPEPVEKPKRSWE